MCVCQSVCSCALNREQTIWLAVADPGGFHTSRKGKFSSRGRALPWNLWKVIRSLFSCLTVDRVGTGIQTSVTTASRLEETQNGKKKRRKKNRTACCCS